MKKLLLALLLTASAFAQRVDLARDVKPGSILQSPNLLTGTPVGGGCVGTVAGLIPGTVTFVETTCGGGAGTVTSITAAGPLTGGTITTSGTIDCPTCATASALTTNRLAKIGTSPALANSSIADDGSKVTGTEPMSVTLTGQTVSYNLPTSGGAANANFLVFDTNTATSGSDRGLAVAKTWDPSGTTTQSMVGISVNATIPSGNSQTINDVLMAGLHANLRYAGSGTFTVACYSCGMHGVYIDNLPTSGTLNVVDGLGMSVGPTTGFAGTISNNYGVQARAGAHGTAGGTIVKNAALAVSGACQQSDGSGTTTTTCTHSYGAFFTPMGSVSGSNPDPWQLYDNSSGAAMVATAADRSQLGQLFVNSLDVYSTGAGSVKVVPLSATPSGTISIPNGPGTLALVGNPLSQFAATTSAQLASVISDETGSGGSPLLMFNQSPTIVTPTIANFTNATHNHTNAAGGGQLTDAALSTAVGLTKGGTGATSQANAAIAILPTATRAGDIVYWDGSIWNHLAGNNSGTNCFSENSSGVPSFAACGGGGGVTSLSGDGAVITNSASTGAVTLTVAGTSGGVPYFNSSSTWITSAALTANSPVLGGGAGAAPKVVAGITTDGTSKLTLGVAGTSVGSVDFKNATSGTITLAPVTGALGTVTVSLPAAAGTVAVSATTPITESAAGAVGCATCVTSAASLTSTAIMTGGGSQGSQTPSATATLNSSGNMSLPGTLAVTGHLTFEGVTSTGATGTALLVFATSPTLTTPNLGTPSAATLTNATGLPFNGVVSATGAIATIANGNNPLVINCALTSGTTCLTTGETTASTTAGAVIHQITTLSTSTAVPFQITQGAGVNATDTPLAFSITGGVGGTNAGATSAGKKGGGGTITTGAGSNAGATSGTGGAGGDLTFTAGNGGTAAVGSLTGAGGSIILTPGSAGGTGTSGAQGNVQVVGGTVGAALTGSFLTVTGTWNTSGVVDAALLVNITNTTSGANSKLIDAKLGGTTQWSVDKGGNTVQKGTATFGSAASNAGAAIFGQGTSNGNTASSVQIQAGTSVTAYTVTLPTAGPTNNNSAWVTTNAAPGVGTFLKMPLIALRTSAYTNATTTFSDVTNLGFAVEANASYKMDCTLVFQSSATTAGPKLQITGPASPTSLLISLDGGTGAAAFADATATSFSSSITAFGTAGATATNFTLHLFMGLENGANAGTVQVQAAANGTGTLTIARDSGCNMQ